MRPVRLTRRYTRHAEGSVLIEFGETRVLCTVSIDDKVPAFLKGKGSGWLTAEYGMLPRSTGTRNEREAARGKQAGARWRFNASSAQPAFRSRPAPAWRTHSDD